MGNTDSYSYEGEYLKGKKHGKGKDYLNGKLIFEGEYLNGKKNGKGKEYYYGSGKLEFEGEYLNGNKHGKGKGYYSDGKLEYETEFSNGEKHGKEKGYYSDGKLKYETEYVNGNKHGKEKGYYSDGKLEYETEFSNGKKHGKEKGYYSDGKLKYETEYVNGKLNIKNSFISLIQILQTSLAQIFNKNGKKITFECEIRGTKEDLNGASLEISIFDKTKCTEFMDINLDHNNKDVYFATLNLEVKEENFIPKIKELFNCLFDFIKDSFDKNSFPFELKFRNNSKQLFIYIVCNDEELAKVLLDLGNNIYEYFKFNLALKSEINLNEVDNDEIDVSKICAFLFSVKTETNNVKYLLEAICKTLKDVKIGNIKIFDKLLGYLDLVNLSLGAKIKLEYDSKVLVEEYVKKRGGRERVKISDVNYVNYAMLVLPILNGLVKSENFNIFDAINCDVARIILGDQRYQNWYELSIKIPGLTNITKINFG